MEFDDKKTCPILLDRIQDLDDQDAWGEFFQFYWDLIIGWAKMNGCSDAMAQDVFQETIINLIRNLPEFEYDRKKGYFRSYLKTIVLRRVRDAFRREGKYVSELKVFDKDGEMLNNTSEDIPDLDNKNDIDMDKHWLQTVLSQALQRSYSKVDYLTYKSFCLHVLEEMSVSEVADKIGVARERNIYEHKNRMLDIIKREFKTIIEAMEGEVPVIDDLQLKNALENLIKGDPEKRLTVEMQGQYVKLFDKITDLKELMSEVSIVEPGAYLIHQKSKGEAMKLSREVTLGRLAECDLRLEDEMVSGHHASIGKSNRGWFIRDNHSRNGVFLNGKKILNKDFLKNGDSIQIASVEPLIFIELEVED